VLVPFVTALVPTVDVAGDRIVLDPPGGMFDTADERDL
jgi:16S rRNA processing protein RimM